MSKTLVAHEQSVSRIFSDDYVFKIPGYQRPYAWTTEQAGELLEDLVAAMVAEGGPVEQMTPYFLGSVVLIKAEGSPMADVVDGQQRLTTLTLLLAAIRAASSVQEADDITPLIYEKGSVVRGTKDRFRLTLRDRDSEFFKKLVQKEGGFGVLCGLADELNDSQGNLRANAIHFKKRLASLAESEILRLAQFIVMRCYLVAVSTPDLDSAYRIFSVLNSRGLNLTATDILKAEIIGAIPEATREIYTGKWEGLEESLGRESFADLFGYIRTIYRKAKPKGTLIKEFKEHVNLAKQPTIFIDELLTPMTRAYQEISDADYESTEFTKDVNRSLRWLNRLEFTDWVPPALAFFVAHRQKPEEMAGFFADLERLAYAMLITKSGINDRIERFSRLTAAIENGVDLGTDASPLQLTAVEQHDVYQRLDGPLYELLAARARSAILLRLDDLLSGGGASYEYETVTVEHVLPQNPLPGSTWLGWFPDAKARVGCVHRLGNLALLTKKKNSSASNYEFDVKKKAYFSKNGISPFVLTTQVLEHSDWTPAVIEARHSSLMGTLEEHWRLGGRKSLLDQLLEL